MKKLFSIVRKENGSVALEFALVAPAMMLIMTSMIEAGHAYLVYSDLQFTLDDVGRYAMLNTSATNSALEEHARDKITRINPDNLQVDVIDTVLTGTTYREITLTYDFPTLAGSVIGDDTISLTRTTRVPIID